MRILTISFYFTPFGGGEIITYNTFKILQNNGNESFFFALNKQPYFEADYKYAKYFPEHFIGLQKNFLDYLKNIPKYFYNFEAANKLKLLLREIKPDIVHCHGLTYLTHSVLKPCFERDIPVVMTIHEPSIACPAGTLLYKDKDYCSNYLCASGSYYHCIFNKCAYNKFERSLRLSLLSYFNKALGYYKNIAKFITPSNALKNLAILSGLDKDKIIVINNFLNDSYLNIIPNYSNKGYFLYVGRLTPEKGIYYLLEAAKILPKEIEFHIVGTGNQEESLKQIARQNNLDNVKFLGFMTGKELENEYRNCIANILPCNWFEVFGMTNIESFVHGKPVIASNIGGIPEIVDHNQNGFLFEPANIEELVKYINILYSDNNLVIKMGQNARGKVKNKYSSKHYYNQLIEVYNSLL